jgi:hypothetical protein
MMAVTVEEGARRFNAYTLGIFSAFKEGLDQAGTVWKMLAQAEAASRGVGRPHKSKRMWQTIVKEPVRTSPPSGHGEFTVRVGASVTMDGLTMFVSLRAGARDVPYARIQELGGKTKAHTIHATRAGALSFFWAKAGHRVAFKSVRHPGSRIPARPYMGGAVAQRAAAPMAAQVTAAQQRWALRSLGVI